MKASKRKTRAAARHTRLSTSVRSSIRSHVARPATIASAARGTVRLDSGHPSTPTPAPVVPESDLKKHRRDWLADSTRIALGGFLLWAGVSKAASGVAFLAALNAYQLPLPRFALAGVAIVLPWIELLCGLLLVTRTRVAPALLLSFGMTLLFCGATGQAVLRGLDISCGCLDLDFLSASPWPQAQKLLESVAAAFVRNVAMLGGIVFLIARLDPARGDQQSNPA
ncbi:MAG: DoxX family protein [Planctomycetota bacterium]